MEVNILKNRRAGVPCVAALACVLGLSAPSCLSAPKTVYVLDLRAARVPVMLGKAPNGGGRAIAAEQIDRTNISAYDSVNVAQQTVHVVETNTVKSKYDAGQQLLQALKSSDTLIWIDEIALNRVFSGDFGLYKFNDSLMVRARALGGSK